MDINTFWEHARNGANLNPLAEWIGQRVRGTVPPPAVAFGQTPAEAEQLARAVLAGQKTTATSMLWQYDDDIPLPEKGDLAIVLDGAGTPRALILTTEVRVVPFSDVDEAHALGESASLEAWRNEQAAAATAADDGNHPLTPDTPMVLERYELLYPVSG